MGILDRWRRSGEDAPDAVLKESMERVVALNPHLRFASRWEKRLAPAVREARTYLRDVVAALPGPREVGSRTWPDDPYVHALFATPEDVTLAVTRSLEVRACFDEAPLADSVVAIMGFEMTQRKTFGTALEGEVMRTEVPRTTVSFHDHVMRLCAPELNALRQEVEARLLDQLAMEAMARMALDQDERERLEQERALLRTRLAMLRRGSTGAQGMLVIPSEEGSRAQLEADLADNERALAGLGLPGTVLDRQLDRLVDVLCHADAYFYILVHRLRLDAMNVVIEAPDDDSPPELLMQCARVPGNPPFERLFGLVRVERDDLMPSNYLLDRAEQFL